MTQADVTPAPPPGPGVLAPFPAPPTEGKRLRIGLGLGVGAALVLLVCGGGLAAVFGLGTVMTRAFDEQAEVVVGNYLTDLKDKRYADAYKQLCGPVRATTSESEFISRVEGDEPIVSWEVGEVNLTDLGVPVDVTYANGDTDTLQATLGQNPETGGVQVCSLGE